MIVSNFKFLFSSLRQEGLTETLHRLAFRFLRINTFYIYALDLHKDLPNIATPEDVKLKELSFDELEKLRGDGSGLPSQFLRDKIGHEDRCFVSLIDGELAFIVWTASKESSGLVKLTPSSVELNHAYCIPKHRGKRLFTLTLSFLSRKLQKENYDKIWSVPHEGNTPSIRTHHKCGFKYVGINVNRLGFITWKSKINHPKQ